jgi:hypothetical protein
MSLNDLFDVSTDLDFDRDLALDDHSIEFAGELNLRLGPHDVWLSGFTLAVSGEAPIDQDVVFGDLVASASEIIATDLDVSALRVQYGYAFVDLGPQAPRVSVTAAFNLYGLEASMRSITTSLSDAINEDIPFPTLGIHTEFPISAFAVHADVSGFYLDVGDLESTYLDASASLSWTPLEHVTLYAGYRAIRIDAGDDSFALDTTMHGPFAGLSIWF